MDTVKDAQVKAQIAQSAVSVLEVMLRTTRAALGEVQAELDAIEKLPEVTQKDLLRRDNLNRQRRRLVGDADRQERDLARAQARLEAAMLEARKGHARACASRTFENLNRLRRLARELESKLTAELEEQAGLNLAAAEAARAVGETVVGFHRDFGRDDGRLALERFADALKREVEDEKHAARQAAQPRPRIANDRVVQVDRDKEQAEADAARNEAAHRASIERVLKHAKNNPRDTMAQAAARLIGDAKPTPQLGGPQRSPFSTKASATKDPMREAMRKLAEEDGARA